MNVYQKAMQRLELIFNEFDNIYVSFSGGKDSGVMLNLCLQYMQQKGIKGKLDAMHLNYEAEYSFTSDYVKRTLARPEINPYNVCVPFKVETCTSMHQSYWRPWEESKKAIWVNNMPENALQKQDFSFYKANMWDYDFQVKFSKWHHTKKKAAKTCVLVGIRTQESLNRWRAIHSDRNYRNYNGHNWTKEVFENIYNAYPIYDWLTEDIWVANAKFGWDYNELYDMYHKSGVPLEKQRVASPFISAAKNSLRLFKAIEPHTWSKLVSRVNGVNFTGIYGGTTAMGWGSITKPDKYTWQEYMVFLLNTLPQETKEGYVNKLKTSIEFWQNKGGVLDDGIIEQLKQRGVELNIKEESNYNTSKKPVTMAYLDDIDIKDFKMVPTYKRMCVCIMKNDHLCKYMGFSLTKNEMEKRNATIKKYKSLL